MKTIQEMARESHLDVYGLGYSKERFIKVLEGFAALVREEAIAQPQQEPVARIDEMVNRFLAWPLPESVCTDPCTSWPGYSHSRFGTSLLTAIEARQMLEHVLQDTPPPPQRKLMTEAEVAQALSQLPIPPVNKGVDLHAWAMQAVRVLAGERA